MSDLHPDRRRTHTCTSSTLEWPIVEWLKRPWQDQVDIIRLGRGDLGEDRVAWSSFSSLQLLDSFLECANHYVDHLGLHLGEHLIVDRIAELDVEV